MSFQWIIDNAESISINRKKVVANTTARDGTVRSVSRGGQVWRFDVKLPDGIRWSDIRQHITAAERLDRTTTANIQFNDPGHQWFIGYQGNSANYTGFRGTWTAGSTVITLTQSPTTSSGFKFRAGDFIQLGSTGQVYTVALDVPFNENGVTLHRPAYGGGLNTAINVAENCVFRVTCAQFPEWTLFARDQVSWSGPFVFVETLI